MSSSHSPFWNSMAVLLLLFVPFCRGTLSADENSIASSESKSHVAQADYAIVVRGATAKDAEWAKVVEKLQKKHNSTVLTYEKSISEISGELAEIFPRYTCFVTKHEQVNPAFIKAIYRVTADLDEDPYVDTFWAVLTGFDAANALEIAEHSQPLTIGKVASGTEFAADMVREGQWYDELVKNKHVRKDAKGEVQELKGPDDTTQALADLLNDYQPDLMITSGHATQRNWQIGFRYRNGYFKSAQGQMFGQDVSRKRIEIDSKNPKVYLPIGNCLMGDIDGADAMALAWMNDCGVRQMLGYTEPTWYGYMGWGVLDYFVEQPGRYTLTEAFFANHHALMHRLTQEKLNSMDKRGLEFDKNVVAYYGDPKWQATMSELPCRYEQTLASEGDVYTLRIVPKAGEATFLPVNTNGAQRGWRPMVQFLPDRLEMLELLEGADLNPVIADDFVLIPNPRKCDLTREYVVKFRARKL